MGPSLPHCWQEGYWGAGIQRPLDNAKILRHN